MLANAPSQRLHFRDELLARQALQILIHASPSSFESAAGSTGLTRWWSNPASCERRRSSSWPQPVRATSITLLPHGCSRMRRAGLVAVQLRQPDVQQDHVRAERRRPLPPPPGRRGRVRVSLPVQLEQHRPGCRPRPRCRPRPGCGAAPGSAARRRRRRPVPPPVRGSSDRQADDELAALCPRPSLRASTVPPCISTSRLTSVRPMPSPPCDRSSDRVDLREHLEDAAAACRAGCRRRCPRTDTTGLAARAARRSARCARPARCTWRRC